MSGSIVTVCLLCSNIMIDIWIIYVVESRTCNSSIYNVIDFLLSSLVIPTRLLSYKTT